MSYREYGRGVVRLTGNGDDTGWIYPTLLNGWTQYGNPWDCVFRRRNGVTYLQGMLANHSGSGLTSPMFTLPPGFRPGFNAVFYTAQEGNTSGVALNAAVMFVLKNGDVYAASNPGVEWTSLSGIQFLADL